jgi:hypothetical protein
MVGAKGVIFAPSDHLEAMVTVEKMHATIYYDSKIEPLMGGYHAPPKVATTTPAVSYKGPMVHEPTFPKLR